MVHLGTYKHDDCMPESMVSESSCFLFLVSLMSILKI